MMLLTRHIEAVRQKPEHVRKQIALGIAVLLTAIIALIWLAVSVATGTFALTPPSGNTSGSLATPSASGSSSLVGAAGASLTGSSGPARIEVVGVTQSAPLGTRGSAEQPEPTVLPF